MEPAWDASSDIEAEAERLVRSWYPSFRARQAPFQVFAFFRDYNRYQSRGANSWGFRLTEHKLLFSTFLGGIGIRQPTIRWIVGEDSAVSPQGERIPKKELVDRLLTGSWFVKPNDKEGGHGAFLLKQGSTHSAAGDTQQMNARALLKRLERGHFLVQDVVAQSAEYAAFAPNSLNTVRCLTYLSAARSAEPVAATLRMGSGISVVDNASSGGIYCGIDIETLRLIGPGRDLDGNLFDQHPVSGIALRGAPLTRLNEVFAICTFAHEVLGGVLDTHPATIGWDVGMTDEGPCVIEGNDLWMAALHSRVDPDARIRLLARFLRDFDIPGAGFPQDLPQIRKGDLATVVFRVRGKVQSVGYRLWIARVAKTKSLVHAASNVADNGDVEVTLTGPLRTLEFAIASAVRGPTRARVAEIEILSLAATGKPR